LPCRYCSVAPLAQVFLPLCFTVVHTL
jgi:hypothetical protein